MQEGRSTGPEAPPGVGAETSSLPEAVRPERRAAPRQALREPLAARIRGLLPARILDISPVGALVETSSPLRPLSRYDVVIELQDDPLEVLVWVQRSVAWGNGVDANGRRSLLYRSGVEFNGPSRKAVDRLERNLALLDPDASGRAGSLPLAGHEGGPLDYGAAPPVRTWQARSAATARARAVRS